MSDGATTKTVVRVLMTPNDLRESADRMEKFWRDANIGDELKVNTWMGKGVDVEFCVDQERMRRDFGNFGEAP